MSRRPRTLRRALPGLGRVLVTLWPYARPERPLIAGSFASLLATVGLRVLEPWPLKWVFDRVLGGGAKAAGDTAILLAGAALAVVAISGLRAGTQYLNQIGFAKIGNRVLARVRIRVFRHLQSLPLSFHTRSRSGDLVIRVVQDVNMLRDVAVSAILPLAANALVLAAMWGVMGWMDWRLTMVALLPVPLLWLRTRRLTSRIRDAGRKQRKRQGALASAAAESISAIKNVQALSLEGIFLDAFGASNSATQKQDVRAAKLSAGLGRSVDVLLAVATALVIWFGARQVLSGELTAGGLLVFLTYLRRAFTPAQDFAKYTGRVAKATAAGERVLELLEIEPEVRDLPGAEPAPPLTGRVAFAGVRLAYADGAPVLDGLEVEIAPREHVALVGVSGAGKSTVVNLLLRLYDPQQGAVLLDGRDIRDFTLESLRAQVSVVLQDSLLFAATVHENIAYGAPGTDREQVEAAARLVNAHGFITALPQGYETVLGERGVTLSGGQRQRIAIARAAVRRAPILIFDEPTTGLDEENRRQVMDALERLAEGRTTLWIAHDLEVCARVDRVLHLVGGRLAEVGSHDELVRRGGRYASLYHLQAGGRARAGAAGLAEISESAPRSPGSGSVRGAPLAGPRRILAGEREDLRASR